MTRKSAVSCAAIALIVATATLCGRMISVGGVIAATTDLLLSVSDSKYVFLLLVNLVFIVCGMFLETNTSVILFAPIFAPIAQRYGVP